LGKVFQLPWPSEGPLYSPDHHAIYEMQGEAMKGPKGPGERRIVGWRLPHSMHMPSGRKSNGPLLKKLVTSSKMLVKGTTKKMATVLVRS